jgi:diguanylate cyclase (GGDEF)-like protein
LYFRSTLQSPSWRGRRALLDLVVLAGSFILFLWVAYEFSLFGEAAGKVLDPARRIDLYESLAAGAFLFCGLWIFALRRASELRMEIQRRQEAETRAADADFRARHDPLTGLGNRAKFDDILAGLTTGAMASKGMTALLLLDLNGFKTVNDRFGHPFGDEVLRIVAERLRFSTRAGDQICRLGGDEFAVLFPANEVLSTEILDPAEALAQKLIQTVDAPIQVGGREVRVGVAIGIAYRISASLSASEIVAAADTALYHAKEKSRLHGQSCYSRSPDQALASEAVTTSIE